ncbi:hypothetical protein [Thermosphaera sp.]
MGSIFREQGRSVAVYVLLGVVLGLFIGTIAGAVRMFFSTTAGAFTIFHQEGVNKTVGEAPSSVSVQLGNETIDLSEPRNPALKTLFNMLAAFLTAVANILGNPATLAVVISLSIVAWALMRK